MYTKITIYTCGCTQCVVYYTRKLQNITKHYKTLQNMDGTRNDKRRNYPKHKKNH